MNPFSEDIIQESLILIHENQFYHHHLFFWLIIMKNGYRNCDTFIQQCLELPKRFEEGNH